MPIAVVVSVKLGVTLNGADGSPVAESVVVIAGVGGAGGGAGPDPVHRQAHHRRLVDHLQVVAALGRRCRVLLLRERERLADGHRAVEPLGEQQVQLLGIGTAAVSPRP